MYLLAALVIALEVTIGLISAQPSHNVARGNHILGESDTTSDQGSSDASQQTQDNSSPPAAGEGQQDSSGQPPPQQSDQVPVVAQPVENTNTAPSESSPQDTSSSQATQQNNTSLETTPAEADTTPQEPQTTTIPANTNQSQSTGQDTQSQQQEQQQNAVVATVQKLDAAAFPDSSSESPSAGLSDQTITQVQQEEEQLQKAQTPQEQASVLVQSADKTIQAVNTNLKKSEFDDMAFSAERLSYQIDKSVDTIQQLPPIQAFAFRNKIQAICKNTEYVLRPEQLVVPEDVEQSLEITRGKCSAFVK